MPGELTQLVAFGSYDRNIPEHEHRYAIGNHNLTFNLINNDITNANGKCIINRNGDLFLPKKIMCYNCSDDFSIKGIKLLIGGQGKITISDTSTINSLIPDFIEDINIDGAHHKVYHLDKTELFFNIKLIALQYRGVSVDIQITGSSQQIKLNGQYTYLDTNDRIEMAQGQHEEIIKQIRLGFTENYNSGDNLKLYFSGNLNGFFITDINPNIINSICFKLNGHDRLNYQDKLEIMMNTQRINDNTIYINLNNEGFMDNVSNASLNAERMDAINLYLGIDEGNTDISFKIGYYSNNVLRIMSGMGSLAYAFNNNFSIKNMTTRTNYYYDNNYRRVSEETIINQFSSPSFGLPVTATISRNGDLINTIPPTRILPSQQQPWTKKAKLMTGDSLCPVLYEEITGNYIQCHQCHKNFDETVVENWVKRHKSCPMCRVAWQDFTIYENREDTPELENVNIILNTVSVS